MAMTIGR